MDAAAGGRGGNDAGRKRGGRGGRGKSSNDREGRRRIGYNGRQGGARRDRGAGGDNNRNDNSSRGGSGRRDGGARRRGGRGGQDRREGGRGGSRDAPRRRFGRGGQRRGPSDAAPAQASRPPAVSGDALQLLRQLQNRIRVLESQRAPTNAVRRFGDRVDRAAGDRRPRENRGPRRSEFAERRTRFGQGLRRGREDDAPRRRDDFGRRRFDEPRRGARTLDDWDEGFESFTKRRRRETPDYYPPLRVHVRR